jgi:PKD repeat protein
MKNTILRLIVAAAATAAGACVHQTEAPPLTGPSTFAQSLTIAANPDHITQDGVAKSQIEVQAIDAAGKPLPPNTPIRFDVLAGPQLAAIGTLSLGTVSPQTALTDASGKAVVTYTAAPPAPPPANSTVNTVSIQAFIANGDDAATTHPVFVSVALMPIGMVLPPSDTPVPNFQVIPSGPTAGAPVTFDGSGSTGVSPIVTYLWNFGDGSDPASGPITTHVYRSAATYLVTLTVTNARGAQAQKSQTVAVGQAALPQPQIVFSPGSPAALQNVQFTDNSTPVPGRTNVAWDWNFGDPASGVLNTASGRSVNHSFTSSSTLVGPYTVVLTVTDDLGQQATATASISVK